MICTSVNRERFICRHLERDGLYQFFADLQGLRSVKAAAARAPVLSASYADWP